MQPKTIKMEYKWMGAINSQVNKISYRAFIHSPSILFPVLKLDRRSESISQQNHNSYILYINVLLNALIKIGLWFRIFLFFTLLPSEKPTNEITFAHIVIIYCSSKRDYNNWAECKLLDPRRIFSISVEAPPY